MFPTTIKDIDIEILIKLPDKDLVNVCQTNKALFDICKSEEFWYRKIRYIFPYLDPAIMEEYKDDGSWSEYYIKKLLPFINYSNHSLSFYSRHDHRRDLAIIALKRNVESRGPRKGDLPKAVRIGYIDMVKALLEVGADINEVPFNYGGTLLTYAAELGYVEIVKLLLDAGAGISKNHYHALIEASSEGHADVVKLLLEKGKEHGITREDINQALVYAETPEVSKLLLSAGADVHYENDKAIEFQSNNGNTEVVKVLLEAGADVHADDDDPLMAAVELELPDMVKMLLEASADVHARNNKALTLAHESENHEIIELMEKYM